MLELIFKDYAEEKEDDWFFNKYPFDFKPRFEAAGHSGEFLAYILASRHCFPNHTVSLVGHSMGCEVLTNTLKHLHDDFEA